MKAFKNKITRGKNFKKAIEKLDEIKIEDVPPETKNDIADLYKKKLEECENLLNKPL